MRLNMGGVFQLSQIVANRLLHSATCGKHLMGAAVYLASAASRLTGQYICVDGGASIA
jgi:NAD(P)-dependent dehydrogenase (short-subunit alcohol dehydrogenase family)